MPRGRVSAGATTQSETYLVKLKESQHHTVVNVGGKQLRESVRDEPGYFLAAHARLDEKVRTDVQQRNA